MKKETERKLEEAYNHFKPYIKDDELLPEMCCKCEQWCGKEHDYEECRNEMCFKFYLGFRYLDWCNSYRSWG